LIGIFKVKEGKLKIENGLEGSAYLLGLSIDDLFKEAYKAIEKEDIDKLNDIGILVKRYFCKKIAQFQIEELAPYNKLLVNFLIWFDWGGEPKWDKAVPIINEFETILELSQIISDTESPQKAFKELNKSSYGVPLVKMLYEKKMMKPGEIREALNIKTMQQVSNLLYTFEKAGIVIREVDGKNVWVSLGMPGMVMYKEYFKPETDFNTIDIRALKSLNPNHEKSKETLQQLIENEPDNPFLIYLSGIVMLEDEEKLLDAGKLLKKAVLLGLGEIYKRLVIDVFIILENMKRLDSLKDRLFKLNTYEDKISVEIKPTLHILGWLYEYLGNTPRANECHRLAS